MKDLRSALHHMTYGSLWILALGSFTSITLLALSHVLIVIPGLYFFGESLRKRTFQIPWSAWALLGIVASIFLSVFFNLDELHNSPMKHLGKSKYYLLSFLSIFAYAAFFKEKMTASKVKWLIGVFFLTTSLATLSGIIGLYSGFNPLKMKAACHEYRACGLLGMYMTYGYGISLFSILTTGLLVHLKSVRNFISPKWLVLTFVINLLGSLLSYARGGWLGYLVAVPFFFFKGRIKLFIMSVASLMIVALGLLALSPQVQKTVFQRDGSNSQRLAYFEAAYRGFQERPIFGMGYRNFEPHVTEIKQRYDIAFPNLGGHAHNNFLEHLATTGLVGAVFFLLFHFFWLAETYRRDDLLGKLLFPFVIGFTVSGLFQYTFGDGENLFMIMALYALGVATDPNKRLS